MKNSRIKLQRQTTHPYFTSLPNSENALCPESKDQHHHQVAIKNNTYESDYNYFTGRMAMQGQGQNKQSSLAHHRHASLGNSRTYGTVQGTVLSPTFTPFLQFHAKQHRNMEGVSKNSVRPTQTHQLSKQSIKLSMKNTFKESGGSNNYAFSNVKQSQASTLHQNPSSIAKQRLVDSEMCGYLKTLMQKRIKQLKAQISDQSSLIICLQNQLKVLSTKLKERQQIMQALPMLNKRITAIEQQISNHISNKLVEQTDLQNNLTTKINHILQTLKVLISIKNQKSDITEMRKNISVLKQIFHANAKIMHDFAAIKQNVSSISTNCLNIKQVLRGQQKQGQSQNIFNQTAQFGVNSKQWKNKDSELSQKRELNQSTSYFFHASQFRNMEKFSEIFMKRQGEPIRCYTDCLNQVKYKDTETFMYNKKGDIVTLTESEKRYYIDKGFIAQSY